MARGGATLTRHDIDRTHKFDWEVDGFAGMDNSSDPSALADNISPNVLNSVYDLTGAIESRRGYTKLNTTSFPGAIINEHPFYKSDGSKTVIFAGNATDSTTAPGGLVGTYLCKYDNAGGYSIIGGPYTLNTFWDFTTLNDSVYACNGANGVLVWTGSGLFIISNPSLNIQFIENRKNRLYGLIGNILYFTDAGNPASWPANNYVQINTNDNQVGTGLKKYFDDLVIFKTQSVWYLQGEPLGSGLNTTIGNLQLRQADSEVGCPSILTVKKVRRGVLMWGCESGVAVMQNYHVDIISESVEKTFSTDMNPNFLNKMWAIYSPPEKKYLLGYPSAGSSTPDKVLLVDMGNPNKVKFAIWDHYPGSCAILFRFTGRDSVLIGHPTKGYIVQAFQGYADIAGDNGTATGAANSVDPPYNVTTTATNINLVKNPGFEVDVSGWTYAGSGGITRNTGASTPNGFSASLSGPSAGGASLTQTLLSSCGAGRTFTLSLYIHNINMDGQDVYIYHNGAPLTPSITSAINTGSGFIRYTCTVTTTAPTGALQIIAFAAPGTTYDLACIQVEEAGAATSFFDGDTAASGANTYAWSGTPYASTSTRTITTVTTITPTTLKGRLSDTSKAWATNQFADADVTIISGTGAGQQRGIVSNTPTQLTLAATWTVIPDATSVYSIGAYASFADTPIEDFGKAAYDKKVKYMNIFTDAHSGENLLFGHAIAYQSLSFSDAKSIAGGGLIWGNTDVDTGVRMKWGKVGKKWGSKKQLFLQYEIGDVDKKFQARFGNNRALQPWRVSMYTITLKFKKVRPDVV